MRPIVAVLLIIHGLIHLLGVAKAFSLGNVSAIRQPITPVEGYGWLAAAVLLIASAIALLQHRGWWWLVALCGAVVSQWMLSRAWNDAKYGTTVNVLILLPVLLALTGRFAHA